MWEIFSEAARKSVYYAQVEAEQAQDQFVSSGHLLIGVVRSDNGAASSIIESLGVDPDRIIAEVRRRLARGSKPVDAKLMQLTMAGKRIIDTAYAEARTLNHDYIGTEHLLLALIAEPGGIGGGIGGAVLRDLGVRLDAARNTVASGTWRDEMAQAPSETGTVWPPPPRRPKAAARPAAASGKPEPEARRLDEGLIDALVEAGNLATAMSSTSATPDHVLVVLLARPTSTCRDLISRIGADPKPVVERVRSALAVDLASRQSFLGFLTRHRLADMDALGHFMRQVALLAGSLSKDTATEEHALVAIARDQSCVAGQALRESGATADALLDLLAEDESTAFGGHG